MLRTLLLATLLFATLPAKLAAQAPVPGKNTVLLRGQAQSIYFYPGAISGTAPRGKVLYLPGDIGMFGLGNTIAKTMASWGYDVYGLDTRSYLSSFTGKKPLQADQVMEDFLEMANWIHHASGNRIDEKIALVGWSEGAGLCLLAAVPEDNKQQFSGLITLGLTEFPTLAWHWMDLISAVVSRLPSEPSFSAADYLPRIAPSKFLMIQSTGDQYVAVSTAQRLFSSAQEPKRFQLIQAKNHRFEGNQGLLYQSLREGLEWILDSPRPP